MHDKCSKEQFNDQEININKKYIKFWRITYEITSLNMPFFRQALHESFVKLLLLLQKNKGSFNSLNFL